MDEERVQTSISVQCAPYGMLMMRPIPEVMWTLRA